MAQKVSRYIKQYKESGKKCAALVSKETAEYLSGEKLYILGSRQDENEMAKEYYSALLALEGSADIILVEAMPESGIGLAYMNRVLRSASFKILD
jgi:L-threonylcarbamoyladenylate synthase